MMIRFILVAAVVAFVSLVSIEVAEAALPNVVLIFADDLGVNDLSCYGRKDQATPNLDALAMSGIKFNCAYTAQPICSPSRAALMTGKYPARLHLTNYLPGRPDANSQKVIQPIIEGQLPLEEPTIAEWLKAAGYATGIFGKWHLGNKDFGPEKQGFDTVVSPPANSKPSDVEGGKSEYAITNAAIEFIREHRESPFFCYVAHNNPHIPLGAKPELVAKHESSFHPVYAAMIETLDDTVGLLMKEVKELGIEDNTIIVFTSDNGGLHVPEGPNAPPTHNTPFRAGKGYVYEGGLREPLIIGWPQRISAGSISEVPVMLTDLVPTFLEAAGIDVAKTVGPLDGVSLLPLFEGKAIATRDLFWHFPNYTNQGGRPAGAMRRGDWKLIRQYEDDRMELYNLANDPSEANDLTSDQPALVNEMSEAFSQWLVRVGAQMVQPNPDYDPAQHDFIYSHHDSSSIAPAETATEMVASWQSWRDAMNEATKGRRARITPAQGDIRLLARDAIVHAESMRYEPQTNKDVLGFWVNPNDWAEWTFEVSKPGEYEIEVQQGCGSGNGGSTVEVQVADQSLSFTVIETGHFQSMAQFAIGTVVLEAGKQTIAVKPKNKTGKAVMDLRRIVLRPRP
jgi:arylsulfatase A